MENKTQQKMKDNKAHSPINDVRKHIEFRDSGAFILSIEQGGAITHVSRKVADYLSEEDYAYLDGEAYKFFRGLSSLHPRLKKYLEHQGMDMLQFVEEELCFKSYFYHTIKDIVRAIGAVEKIVDVEQPYKIILNNAAGLFNKVAAVVAQKMGLLVVVRGTGAKERMRQLYRERCIPFLYESYISLQRWKRGLLPKAKPNNGPILFLPYYANHVDVLQPVVKLMERQKENVDLIELDNIFNVTRRQLEKYGMGYEVFEKYADTQVRQAARQHALEFRKSWKALCEDAEVQNSLQFRKIPLWPVLKPRLKQLFLVRFPQITWYLDTAKNMVDIKRPSLLVYANDNSTFGRAAYAVAQSRRIPSLVIQHGALADDPRFDKVSAGMIAVEGPAVRDYLVKRGVDMNKIVVTGQPRFDVLAKKEGIPSKEEICAALGILPSEKIVTLAAQVPECDEKVVAAACAALRAMKGFVLVIKMHPAERKEREKMYRQAAQKSGCPRTVIVKDIHLYGLLAASEFMMTVFSTVALESMMLGTPVITINLTGEPDMMPYASSGAALGVRKAGELPKAIDELLHNAQVKKKLKKGMEKFVYERAYTMDGRAAERVVGLIRSMAGNPAAQGKLRSRKR